MVMKSTAMRSARGDERNSSASVSPVAALAHRVNFWLREMGDPWPWSESRQIDSFPIYLRINVASWITAKPQNPPTLRALVSSIIGSAKCQAALQRMERNGMGR
jgi:hypothetical protein